mmetsp:Transcript_10190/g.22059  ORF Transcript_10190/g.22059 Transcript_10190/m.22059 type:complete len:967 (+) Transcript_10190:216-3116(+)
MQRYTIKISHEPQRRLGLNLIRKAFEQDLYSDSESDFDDEYYEYSGPINIRGGGSTVQTNDPVPGPMNGISQPDSPIDGLSLQMELAAQATAAAAAAAAAAASNSAQGNTVPRVSKRKRPTKLCVSDQSTIFKFADYLLSPVVAKPECINAVNPFNTSDSSNVDALIEWGRKTVPQEIIDGTHQQLRDINGDAVKFVLTGTLKPFDIVEKIQYARSESKTLAKAVSVKGKKKSGNWKRRCRPYFRSDHYATIYCENKSPRELVAILKSAQNYPLYITFKRQTPVSNSNCSARTTSSPPRKRLKTSGSNNSGTTKSGQNEVICLLDSSDEEECEVEKGKGEAHVVGDSKQDQTDDLTLAATEPHPLPQAAPQPQPQLAPPDPRQMSSLDDDFVLTPFGPGKIVSSRIERNASLEKDSDATIFKPTIIYSIDLHFGICHLPASQVKPISGTSYTEKTLMTYQRVPLSGHDLLRLRPMTYLNDSIIMFYLKYLKAQLEPNNGRKPLTQNRGWDDLDGEGIYIFPSFCYTRIKNIMGPGSRNSKAIRTKIMNDLKSWTKNDDIFQKKLLIFPVNESLHWTCVCVFHPGRLVRRHARKVVGKEGNAICKDNAGPGKSHSTTNPLCTITDNVTTKTQDLAKENQSQKNATGTGDKSKAASETQSTVKTTESAPDNMPTKAPGLASGSQSQKNGNEEESKASTENHSTVKPFGSVPDDVAMESSDLVTESHPPPKNIVAAIESNVANENHSTVKPTSSVPDDVTIESTVVRSEINAPNTVAAMKSKSTNQNLNRANTLSKAASKPKPKKILKWQCDFCKKARFEVYDDAVEHEKRCDANIDWCMIHFDSGKHFKLHKTTEILSNIRKYLNAYYDSEYATSHPNCSFSVKNMPGFAAAIPQQDNTKDCGVYMLENAERMMRCTPVIDNEFVKRKGMITKSFFGKNGYDKSAIEKKRDNILQLIQTLRRAETEID